MSRRFSMYWATPSAEVNLIKPTLLQYACHQLRCVPHSLLVLAIASEPIRLPMVLIALPPIGFLLVRNGLLTGQEGAITITLKEPSALGLKLTWTVSAFITEALTLRPPAVIPANEPKVLPEETLPVLSTQVSAKEANAPLAVAVGERPVHNCTCAVCVLFGSAPFTSTMSSSLSCGT